VTRLNPNGRDQHFPSATERMQWLAPGGEAKADTYFSTRRKSWLGEQWKMFKPQLTGGAKLKGGVTGRDYATGTVSGTGKSSKKRNLYAKELTQEQKEQNCVVLCGAIACEGWKEGCQEKEYIKPVGKASRDQPQDPGQSQLDSRGYTNQKNDQKNSDVGGRKGDPKDINKSWFRGSSSQDTVSGRFGAVRSKIKQAGRDTLTGYLKAAENEEIRPCGALPSTCRGDLDRARDQGDGFWVHAFPPCNRCRTNLESTITTMANFKALSNKLWKYDYEVCVDECNLVDITPIEA